MYFRKTREEAQCHRKVKKLAKRCRHNYRTTFKGPAMNMYNDSLEHVL